MAGGRPRRITKRYLHDFPPPTPQRTPCRIWQGPLDRDGYGVVSGSTKAGRFRKSAHRWVYEAVYGPLPPGQVVRHRCDNRPCYRLSHLVAGTVADNVEDARRVGHLGTAIKLAPSEVRWLFEQRALGLSYQAIFDQWPGGCPVGFSTLKLAGARGRDAYDENFDRLEPPPPPPDPVENYRSWRDDGVVRPRAIRWEYPDA